MRLRDFLNLYAATAILGGLAFWAAACFSIYSPPAEARAHQPESTRALDMPRASSGARAVPPSGGDLRLHTEGKAHQKRAGLTPRKDAGFASESPTETVRPETEGLLVLASPGSGVHAVARSQGVRLVPGREKSVLVESPAGASQAFEGGAAWSRSGINREAKFNGAGTHLLNGNEDTLMTLTEKPKGSAEALRDVAHRPAARGVLPNGMELGQAGIKPGHHLRALATNAANLCGVPVALFHSLISKESSWRPHVISRAGAVGLAQVKPSTGRGVSPGLDVHDPWQNLVAGACYLRRQFDRFGTWRAALHAYRLGPSAVVTRTAREYASDIMGGAQ